MRIALLGYGKMGKAIEKIALKRGHTIGIKIDNSDEKIDFDQIDVAIDFSTPQAAYTNIKKALDNRIPVISGTTGWLDRYDEIVSICQAKKGSFLYASNFSLGVNLFFEINTFVAKFLKNFDYEPSIIETHHIHKIDAPSGTAITLANQILPFTTKKQWKLNAENSTQLNIEAKRIDEVPGTHQVIYDASVDQIEIKHTAKNRDGFALGAIIAAEFIADKKGVFSMKDVLGINSEV